MCAARARCGQLRDVRYVTLEEDGYVSVIPGAASDFVTAPFPSPTTAS